MYGELWSYLHFQKFRLFRVRARKSFLCNSLQQGYECFRNSVTRNSSVPIQHELHSLFKMPITNLWRKLLVKTWKKIYTMVCTCMRFCAFLNLIFFHDFSAFQTSPSKFLAKGWSSFPCACCTITLKNNYQLFQHWKPPFKDNTLTFILFEWIF